MAGALRSGYPRVRILCEDGEGRLLLLKWRDPTDGRTFYEPPGGGVEAGESPAEAAVRELYEETGLAGPVSEHLVAVERRHRWRGRQRHETEAFFHRRVAPGEQVCPGALTESESETLLEWRWVGRSELGRLGAPVEPSAVFEVLDELRGLVAG